MTRRARSGVWSRGGGCCLPVVSAPLPHILLLSYVYVMMWQIPELPFLPLHSCAVPVSAHFPVSVVVPSSRLRFCPPSRSRSRHVCVCVRVYEFVCLFFLFFFISLIADGLIITILPVVTKDLSISPRFTPYNFLSRCKFSTLTTRQPMVEFYLLTFPRFPLRKKEYKSCFGKNRTHDFRTSRCAGYLLDHSSDEAVHLLNCT